MWNMPIILAAIFIAVTLLVLAFYSYMQWLFLGPEYKIGKRLTKFTRDDKSRTSEIPYLIRDDQLSKIPLLNRILEKFHLSTNLQRMINQADLSMRVGELVMLILIAGGLGMILGIHLENTLLTVGLAVFFSVIPLIFVHRRRAERLRHFTEQFPDVLDMMTSALRAGHGFGRALQLVATEVPDPAGKEFRKTFEENNLGIPSREALMNFTERIDSVDLKLFATAVTIQRESGGDLTEILTNISQTIRERFRLLGQIRIYTTQGRITTWILGVLPVVLAVIISLFDPEYIGFLFTDPRGQFMTVVAVILQLIGFIMIKKIVKMIKKIVKMKVQ
jgi:tight adherence protein B